MIVRMGDLRFRMLGAPEVICLNGAIIKALKAKKVIDVGVFTGASTLAAAVALPPDGKVVACDISEEYTRQAETYWKEAGVDDKVDLRIAPAGETLKRKSLSLRKGNIKFCISLILKCKFEKPILTQKFA